MNMCAQPMSFSTLIFSLLQLLRVLSPIHSPLTWQTVNECADLLEDSRGATSSRSEERKRDACALHRRVCGSPPGGIWPRRHRVKSGATRNAHAVPGSRLRVVAASHTQVAQFAPTHRSPHELLQLAIAAQFAVPVGLR